MRLIMLGAAVAAIAACDSKGSLSAGGIAGPIILATDTAGAAPLAISPNSATLPVGATLQLSTNAPQSLQSQVVWRSTTPSVASVTNTGNVTALSRGSTTIIARFSFDTTRTTAATVTVTSP